MTEPDQAALDKVLRGIDIPSCPAVLTALQKEIAAPNSSLARIGQIVNTDVALAASVLKAANSPAFGLSRKVSTIAQAIPVLGMRAISSVAAGVILRNTMSAGTGPRLDRFWDSTTRVATLCSRLTREFKGVPAETAYTFGLFHDCGIAVLMKRFPDYRETLQLANASPDRCFTDIEDERHNTNHVTIGYFLTRNWGLPEEISSATLLHHDFSIFTKGADNTAARARTLVALATLSAYYVNSYQRMAEDANWQQGRDPVMAHLGISEKDLFDLREICFEALAEL